MNGVRRYSRNPTERIVNVGWVHLRASGKSTLETEVLSLAQSLGAITVGRGGRVVEVLEPLAKGSAKMNSLSALYGQGAFPLHTDGAHRLVPPRYLILACDQPGSFPVPTIFQRFESIEMSDAERQACEAATFLIRNGRRSFYSTILTSGRPFLRFDIGCMVPLNDDGREAMGTIAAKSAAVVPEGHHWSAGDILVIDNWRVLHGRGRSSDYASRDRRLLRVSVQ